MLRLTARLASQGGGRKHSVKTRILNVAGAGIVLGGSWYAYGKYQNYLKSLVETEEKAKQHFQKMENWDYGNEDFSLVNCKDLRGRRVTNGDFKGKWSLLYFGFTHCPDMECSM